MKKVLLIIVTLLFCTSLIYAGDPIGVSALALKIKTEAEKELEPVVDIFGTCLNSGIYAPVSGKFFSLNFKHHFPF